MNKNYIQYCGYLLLSLFLTTFGAFIADGERVSTFTSLIMSIGLIIAFSVSKGSLKKIIFIIFCFGEGYHISHILTYYSNVKLYECLFITFVVTLIFLIIGMIAKNLSGMGSFLFYGLIIFVVYNIASMFMSLPSLAIIGVLIFSLYIAYDINTFKQRAEGELTAEEVLNRVMDMYLNVLNIFILILRLSRD